MKTVFLDTSIFVAAFWKKHPHFEESFQLLSQSKNLNMITSQHAIVEYYSVMTRIPVPSKVEPTLIFTMIQENILPYIEVQSLNTKESLAFVKQASILQVQGGNIHDFYHYSVALKSKASILYTLNPKDFAKFPEGIDIKKPAA
ncbi:type II toxin-antitoxin system VapC family toxin [Leptospira sp. GIMC2001]|uniref:type II toxin-antitoxin system VapC family toxin n=1 Tax=Leptospira sp. GIMC2001 TaxID=1513297 RepID=UPI00234B7CB2|nr:PIN domain-containing protein [Leptospira sp. GIMC2001]WCL47778.1 PIN domain-containing protein [Leptospira sp. GIMC2001]